MKKLPLVILALTQAFISSVVAAEKGTLGFSLKIDASGIFSPTVNSAKIASIVPNSPAAEQHLAVGDEIVQIESTEVSGHKASELKPLIQKQVGETVHLKLKRPNGETYSATLVAVKPPR